MLNGKVGGILARGMTYNDSQVVCREVGYIGVETFSQLDNYGPVNGSLLIFKLGCNGNEPNISMCPYVTFDEIREEDKRYQRPDYAAGVMCNTSKKEQKQGKHLQKWKNKQTNKAEQNATEFTGKLTRFTGQQTPSRERADHKWVLLIDFMACGHLLSDKFNF